ncbi:TPA: hypothetical protein ACPJYH_001804, partial [Haemophilus influenzae]
SYSLEDIILKLLYFFISLVTSHYFSKLTKWLKWYRKKKKMVNNLSDLEKEFLKNIPLNPKMDKNDLPEQFNPLKDLGLFTYDFAEVEVEDAAGNYIFSSKDKDAIELKLTNLGKDIVDELSN